MRLGFESTGLASADFLTKQHGGADDLFMRLNCDERNRLWIEYSQALDSYSHAIRSATRFPNSQALLAAVGEAHKIIEKCRCSIRDHCLEHGCNPEWSKEFGEK